MLIPGHLAAGVLTVAALRLAQPDRPPRPPFRRVLLPTLVGTLTPDLIDKPLQWAGVVSSSRALGHSPTLFLALLGLALATWYLSGETLRRWATVALFWVAGIGSHILVDYVDEQIIDHFSRPTPLEYAVIVAAIFWIWWWYRPRH
jgi:hypothetical protein